MANMNKLKHPALGSSPLRGGVQKPACQSPNPARQNEKGEQKANRERIRLEIDVTLTKQRIGHRSNREKNTHFDTATGPPYPNPYPNISNREPIRLETHVTHTKQTVDHHSNREKNTHFHIAIDPPPNREPYRLPIHSSSTATPGCVQLSASRRKVTEPVAMDAKHSKVRPTSAPQARISSCPLRRFFRIAFSPHNSYPRRDLSFRRRAPCPCDH